MTRATSSSKHPHNEDLLRDRAIYQIRTDCAACRYWWNPHTSSAVWIHPKTGLFPDGRRPAAVQPKAQAQAQAQVRITTVTHHEP